MIGIVSLLLCLAYSSHSQEITFIGNDGDWENPSNWDAGIVPDSNCTVIIPSAFFVSLPALPMFSQLTCNGCQLHIPQNCTIVGTIELNFAAVLNASSTIQGTGMISGGNLQLFDAKIHIIVQAPFTITFYGDSYIDDVEIIKQSCCINGGSLAYESIGTLSVTSANICDLPDTNVTVNKLVSQAATYNINLRVTGKSSVSGGCSFYGIAIFEGPVEWFGGQITVYQSVMEFHDDITCSSKTGGCNFKTYYIPPPNKRAVSSVQFLYIYGGLYGPGPIQLESDSSYTVYLYGPIGTNITCGGSAIYFDYSSIFNIISGGFCNLFINAPNIELPVLSFGGSITSFYDISIGALQCTDAVTLNEGNYFINNSMSLNYPITLNNALLYVDSSVSIDSQNTINLDLYNSSLINYASMDWNGVTIQMYENSFFANYGTMNFLDTSSSYISVYSGSFLNHGAMIFQLNTDGGFINNVLGSFSNYGTMSFYATPAISPPFYIYGGFLNIGNFNAYSNTITFNFQDLTNELYQCSQSSYQINIQQGAASKLLLNSYAFLNGIYQFNFLSMEDYNSLPSTGIEFAQWPTKKINGTSIPLSGNITAIVQIVGTPTNLTGFVCQNISGNESYAYFYTHYVPLNSSNCVLFDQSLLPDNEKCTSSMTPSPAPAPIPIPSASFSPSPIPIPSAYCSGSFTIGICVNGTWIISNSSLGSIVNLTNGNYYIIGNVQNSAQVFLNNAIANVQGTIEISSNGELSLHSATLHTQDLIINNSTLSVDPFSHIVVSGNLYLDDSTIIMDYLNLNIRDELIPLNYSSTSHIGAYNFISKNVYQPDCSQPQAVNHDTHLSVLFDTNSCPNKSVSDVIGGVVGGVLGFLVIAAILIFLNHSYQEKKKTKTLRQKMSNQ